MKLHAWVAGIGRCALRGLLLLGLLLYGGLVVVCCYPALHLQQQSHMRQRWCQQVLRCLGVELCIHQPAPLHAAGQLLVANHQSWLDAVVLGAYMPVDFVAKAELRQWPFLGWLAAQNHTLFLSRYQARQAQAINTQIGMNLRAGKSILAFPEGTTQANGGVLPFYPALFQSAIDAACPVQPMALYYRDGAGAPSLAPAYTGDISFLQSLGRIMAAPRLQAHVHICPAIAPAAQHRRRHLAHQARAAILAQLPSAAASRPKTQLADTGSSSPLQEAAF